MDTLILGYYEKENKIKKIIQISKENNTIQKIIIMVMIIKIMNINSK